MAGVLRPGGWLVIEDFDVSMLTSACVEAVTPAQVRANKIRRGFLTLLGQRGADLEFGRKLPRLLRELGLAEVTADAHFPVAQPAALVLERANTKQVAAGLMAGNLASQQEIDDHLAALEAAELDITTPPLISARGRHR